MTFLIDNQDTVTLKEIIEANNSSFWLGEIDREVISDLKQLEIGGTYYIGLTELERVAAPNKELLNKTFYDCRYEDYYTVTAYDVTGHFLTLEYKKLGTKKEAVSFVNYHIEQQQHLPKK